MKLSDLNRANHKIYCEDRPSDQDQFVDPIWDLFYDLDGAVETLNEDHLEFVEPNIFFNSETITSESEMDQIITSYNKKYPGRHLNIMSITPDALAKYNYAPYPEFERRFLKDGYVSNLDVVGFGQGERDPRTLSDVHHRETVDAQRDVVLALLTESDVLCGMHATVETINSLVGLGPRDPGQRDDSSRLSVPLIQHDHVYRPFVAFPKNATVHMALEGRVCRQNFARRERPAALERIADQLVFELRHAGQLFDGATPDALILWQTQILAFLRKIAWIVNFNNSPALLNALKDRRNHLLSKQKDLRGYDIEKATDGVKFNKARKMLECDPIYLRAVNSELDEYRERLLAQGLIDPAWLPAHDQFSWGFSVRELLIGAAHGATYEPRYDYRDEREANQPIVILSPLAAWMGSLRRDGRAVLDRSIAYRLVKLDEPDPTDDENWTEDMSLAPFRPFFDNRLGVEIRRELTQLARQCLEDGSSINVRYRWTADPDRARSIGMQDGKLVIRGPLLDFPLSAAARWNELAANIVADGGIVKVGQQRQPAAA
ncbi:MAG: hypothetical protein K2P80_03510 [Beijerinckiaceae bacterium]|nr:hypothetical protein [Beijerinckiaceae bacterium]